MELLVVIVLAVVALVVIGSVAGLAALSRTGELGRRVDELYDRHSAALVRLRALEGDGREADPGNTDRAREPSRYLPPIEVVAAAEVAEPEIAAPIEPAPPASVAGPALAVAPPELPPATAASTASVAGPAPQDWWRFVEEHVGKRWITWAGALAVFAGAGFFVKLAVDQGWLGPWARVMMALALGAGLVAAGVRSIRRRMRPLGQGLIGGGLAVLYAAIYAAHASYDLVPQVVAFAVMALVTALGMGLAVWHDARPIAFLAVVGGLATPLVLWPEHDPGGGLFAYLLCLDLGVLGVALHRRWRVLDALAMVGTWGVFLAWHHAFYEPGEIVEPLLWLAAFHAVFLAIPFAFHLRHGTRVARERLAMALTSGCGVFAYATTLLLPGHQHVLGAVAIALGLSFLVVAWLTHRRVPDDDKARLSLVTLAVGFFTIAVPIHLDFHAVTIAWAMEGVVLVVLGFRYRFVPDRVFGLATFAIAAGRAIFMEWPHSAAAPWLDADLGSASVVALAGGAIAVAIHVFEADARPGERHLKVVVALGAVFLALTAATSELWWGLVDAGADGAVRWAGALLWIAGAAALLAAGLALRSLPARLAALATLLGAAVLLFWDYTMGWPPGQMVVLNGRFLTAVAVLGLLGLFVAAAWRAPAVTLGERGAVPTMIGLGLLIAPTLLSAELWQSSHGDLARTLIVASWIAGAAASLAFARRWELTENLRWLGPFQVAVGAAVAGAWYGADLLPGSVPVVWNLRFAVTIAVGAAMAAYGLWLTAHCEELDDTEPSLGRAVVGAGILALALATSAEAWDWAAPTPSGRGLLCLVIAAIWVVASATFLVAGVRLGSAGLRRAGLLALVAAAAVSAIGYGFPLWPGSLLVLNGRFLAPGLVVAMAFVFGGVIRRRAAAGADGDEARMEGRAVLGVGTALAVALLSGETYLYFDQTVGDPERARWLAQTGLSIVWSLSAIAVVAAGFWRRRRALRLAGLGLFAATALKLVLVDMAQVAGGYRVASFMVVGLLMIGVSYLYHRVERWMSSTQAAAGASPAR